MAILHAGSKQLLCVQHKHTHADAMMQVFNIFAGVSTHAVNSSLVPRLLGYMGWLRWVNKSTVMFTAC